MVNQAMEAVQLMNLCPDQALRIYTRTGNTWVEEAYLKASNAGLVEVFQSTRGNWSHSQFITSPTGGNLGWSLDMDGNRAIIGERGANNNLGSQVGTAYIYYYNNVLFANGFE